MHDQGLQPRTLDRVLQVIDFGAGDGHFERSAKSLTRIRRSECSSSRWSILGSGAQHVSIMATTSAGLVVLIVLFSP
jgi:hypothetical protein